MTEYINGVAQMPPEEKEILLKLKSESKRSYKIALVSLVLAAIAIIISVIFIFIG